MAGKHGQRSNKPTEVPAAYAPDFIATLDGRGRVARELRSRLTLLYNDIGGESFLSYQQKSVCERIVHVEALLQSMEYDMANGKEVPLGNYIQGINTLVGLFKTIGLERRTKELSLREYLSNKEAAN